MNNKSCMNIIEQAENICQSLPKEHIMNKIINKCKYKCINSEDRLNECDARLLKDAFGLLSGLALGANLCSKDYQSFCKFNEMIHTA